MKIAIIGANGRVGTELALLLHAQKKEVVPIVRNELGAAFLQHKGLSVVCGDYADSAFLSRVLEGVDVCVIASNASDVGGPTKHSMGINASIIRAAADALPASGTLVYFSSIRAFGSKVDPHASRIFPAPYDLEKQNLEHVVHDACQRAQIKGIAFRLGHVFGPFQPRTQSLAQFGAQKEKELYFRADPHAPSNVVHTVTILNAIEHAPHAKSGTYSLVNVPNWTWEQVFEHYAPKKNLHFLPVQKPARGGISLGQILAWIKPWGRAFQFLRLYWPTSFDRWIQEKYLHFQAKRAIQEYESRQSSGQPTYTSPMCTYNPIPGPFMSGLTSTSTLLAHELPEKTFK